MDSMKNKNELQQHSTGHESITLLNTVDEAKTVTPLLTNDSAADKVQQSENSEILDTVIPLTKFQIWKNIFIVSIGFFFMFAAFNSISNLQSTLNKDEGVGTTGLAIIYGAFVVSFIMVANPVISKFGCKWSMFMAMICYLFYMAANMYPIWGLMIPSSFLVGIGAGPLWTGLSVYFTHISRCLATLTRKKEKDVLMFNFGVFYSIFHTCNIVGNMLSSIILRQHSINRTQPSQIDIERCLANENILTSNITTLERPEPIKVYILCGIWIGLGVLGVTCILFVDNVVLDTTQKNKKLMESVMATINQFRHSRTQKIILPLSLYYGMLQAFVQADYLRSFVGCTIGIETIGYVMIGNACALALSSFVSGRLGKYIGNIPIFTTTFLLAIGVQTTLLIWRPTADSAPVLFTIAALFGVIAATLKSQLLAFYGFIFRDNVDAAFANYYSFEGLGYVISFSYSSYISTPYKLYVLQSFLLVSIVAYYTVEYIQRHKNKDNTKEEVDIHVHTNTKEESEI